MIDPNHHRKEKQKRFIFDFFKARMLFGVRPEPKLPLAADGARLEKLSVDLTKFSRYSTEGR